MTLELQHRDGVNRRNGNLQRTYRTVCQCGWASRWTVSHWLAEEKGAAHEKVCAVPAVLVPAMEPGSAQWMQYMTASKIAAVLGLSSYESRFSLWHRMAGLIPPEPDDEIKRRGHYLEPAIRAWFADQHPEWLVETTGTWVHCEREWQAASPDALAYPREKRVMRPVALAEFKTAHEAEQWGQPGTDEIPIGYRCQVQWQMDTLGIDVCHVAVLTRHLQFSEYVVHANADDQALLREEALGFLQSVWSGDRPEIDGDDATYQAVKELHPDIEPYSVPVPDELGRAYCSAKRAETAAAVEAKRQTALLADYMGSAQTAMWAGRAIASRQSKKSGVPYVVAARDLPCVDEMLEAS